MTKGLPKRPHTPDKFCPSTSWNLHHLDSSHSSREPICNKGIDTRLLLSTSFRDLCLYTCKMYYQPGNCHGQAFFRTSRRTLWSNDQVLPRGQRVVRGQRVHTGLPCKYANPLVLWRELSLSERDS